MFILAGATSTCLTRSTLIPSERNNLVQELVLYNVPPGARQCTTRSTWPVPERALQPLPRVQRFQDEQRLSLLVPSVLSRPSESLSKRPHRQKSADREGEGDDGFRST